VSKISRADWAAQVPASGIVGQIPASALPASSGLTGAGFPDGTIPVWSASQGMFVPRPYPSGGSSAPAASSTITALSPLIVFGGVSLRPLESVEINQDLANVTANSQIFIASPVGQDFVFYTAKVFNAPMATIRVTNMSPSIVALVDQTYQVWVIN
jgi:hypothetical protein